MGHRCRKTSNPTRFEQTQTQGAAEKIIAAIDPRAGVQAPDVLLPHLVEREVVTRIPPPEIKTDFVVLDASHRERFRGQEDVLRAHEEPLARRWLARRDHALVEAQGPWIVLKRGSNPRRGIGVQQARKGRADPSRGTPLCDCLAVMSAGLVDAMLELNLVAAGECPPDLALRLGQRWRPKRVELIARGLWSPRHFRRGDHIVSRHDLSAAERRQVLERRRAAGGGGACQRGTASTE